MKDQIHLVPNEDIKDHEESPNCWCEPEMTKRPEVQEEDTEIWVHKYIKWERH